MSGWRKSSYSANNGACLEVASWRKSSRSGGNGACVEVGCGEAVIGVRDNTLAKSPVLVFSSEAWAAFTSSLKLAH